MVGILIYLVAFIAAVVLHAKANANDYSGRNAERKYLLPAVIIAFIGAVVLVFSIGNMGISSGGYSIYVNGVRQSAGAVSFFEGVAIVIFGTALPGLVGLFVAALIKRSKVAHTKPLKRWKKITAAILAAYCLAGILSNAVLIAIAEDATNNIINIIVLLVIFIWPLSIFLRWTKERKGKK